jgi:hypothetical protein
VLDVVANTLVRSHEVIAVAASGSSIIAMEGHTEPDSATDNGRIPEEDDYSDIRISSISAVVNPDIKDEDKYVFPNGGGCMVISGGNSYIPRRSLQENKVGILSCFQTFCSSCISRAEKKDALLNHIKTVEHYLGRHRKILNATNQMKHENLFALYLVVQCWRKMFQRVVD